MKQLLRKSLSGMGYSISSTKYIPDPFLDNKNIIELEFDHVLSDYLVNIKDDSEFTFIQIGAFDGVECDPLFKYLKKYDWKGIMLEPQPEPFLKLRKQYESRPNIIVLNAALSASEGKTNLYILEGDELPEWSKGMASFSKENILKHEYLLPGIQEYIRSTEIDTISFATIFNDGSISNLDLLQIDTEGFDAAILNMFPFEIVKPKLIHFESKHIPKQELEKLLYKLIDLGYYVARDRAEDMMAVLKKPG